MTKLFYQRGASAALLLGLIVGAPDIAQALDLVPSITGSLTGRESPQTPLPPNVYKPLPPPPPNVGKLLPPIPSREVINSSSRSNSTQGAGTGNCAMMFLRICVPPAFLCATKSRGIELR